MCPKCKGVGWVNGRGGHHDLCPMCLSGLKRPPYDMEDSQERCEGPVERIHRKLGFADDELGEVEDIAKKHNDVETVKRISKVRKDVGEIRKGFDKRNK